MLGSQLTLSASWHAGPESTIAHSDRTQLRKHFPLKPRKWGWQILEFSFSERSSLIVLFLRLKRRGGKSETLSLEKCCKDQINKLLYFRLAQTVLDFACWLPLLAGPSVTAFQNCIWKSLSQDALENKNISSFRKVTKIKERSIGPPQEIIPSGRGGKV